MVKLIQFAIMVLACSVGVTSLAADYVMPKGIPDPTNTWGVLDPVRTPVPDRNTIAPGWFEAQPRDNSISSGDDHDCYYIDKSSPAATDSSNTYGKPTKPRLTIPNIVFTPGAYIEIHGNGSETNVYSSAINPRGTGSAANPIWFVGIDSPVISYNTHFGFANNTNPVSYLIFDGINWMNGGRIEIRPAYTNNSMNHIAFRNCIIKGRSLKGESGGVGVGSTKINDPTRTVQDIVFYNCEVYNWGDKNDPNEECGFYPSMYVTRFWILDCDVHDVAEDGFGGGHGAQRTSSGYYIGRCHIHDNLTNGADIKGMRNIIMSECTINDHYDVWVDGVHKSSGIGQAVTFHYGGNSSGPGSVRNYPEEVNFLFNTVYGAQFAIRTSRCGTLRIIGNIFYNIHTQPEFESVTKTEALQIGGVKGDTWIVNNTFYGNDSSIRLTDSISTYSPATLYYAGYNVGYNGTNYVCWFDNDDVGITGIAPTDTNYWKPILVRIYGNLSSERTKQFQADIDIDSDDWAAATLLMDNNLVYNSLWGGMYNFDTSVPHDLSWMQSNTSYEANSITNNPEFVDGSALNFSITSNSPAIGAYMDGESTISGYTNFYGIWGIDIEFDKLLQQRQRPFSLGAFELDVREMVPEITTQPIGATSGPGYTYTLTCIVNGPNLSYQWYKNESPISTKTNNYLAFTVLTTNDSGTYFLIATNQYGSVQSQDAILNITNAGVLILEQPVGVTTVTTGELATITVIVQGNLPVTYQWFKDGVEIESSTNYQIIFVSAQESDSGTYTVWCTNGVTGELSNPSVLIVTTNSLLPTLSPIKAFYNDSLISGNSYGTRRHQSINLVVEVFSDIPIIGQAWWKNGVILPNENDTEYAISSLNMQDAGVYSFFVTNASGFTSNSISLSVTNIPESPRVLTKF